MPNHLHLIWQLNKLNGRETPKGSFLKFTVHKLLKQLQDAGKSSDYVYDTGKYEFVFLTNLFAAF